jgi:hypothetical protein
VVSLRAYSADGTQTGEHFFIDLTGASFPDQSWSMAPVRTGGVQVTHVSLPGDGSWHLYTQRYSSTGTATDGVQQLATAFSSSVPQYTLTGVGIGGQALVAWDNGAQGRAVWTDAVGHLFGGTFALPLRIDATVQLAPLLDGSIAIRANGQWVYTIQPGSQTAGAAPSWLSTRPGSVLSIARGGRAYALFTAERPEGVCGAHLVIFAPAGNRCGAVDLPSSDPDGCAAAWEMGPDGTAIVQGRTELLPSDPPYAQVSQRFYPQLMR